MRVLPNSRTFSVRTYRIMHGLVRFITCGVIIAIIAAVYLNLLGVPGPILRRVVLRINNAGIPVDVEKVHLSFYGWKATNVRFYSRHPDDLKPIFSASRVFVRSTDVEQEDGSKIRGYRLKAHGLNWSPPVAWCVGMPEDFALTKIEQVALSLARGPNGIVLQEGRVTGEKLEVRFAGALIGYEMLMGEEATLPVERDRPFLTLDEQFCRGVEAELKALAFTEGASVDIDFLIDTEHPAASRLSVDARTGALVYRDVDFSQAELQVSYAMKRLALNHASLQQEHKAFGLKGEYDLNTGEVSARITNDITSKELFLLLPYRMLGVMTKYGIRSGTFPRLDIQAGPSPPSRLLQNVTGSFSVRDAVIRGVECSALSGAFSRKDTRLEVFDLEGDVVGQEHRSRETGSCMRGGSASGVFFLDTATHELGFSTKSDADPNLILDALKGVDSAVNVISRFRFGEEPPKLRVEVAASYDDWSSVSVAVDGSAEDLFLHGVPLSSLSASALYSEGILALDQVVAMQEDECLKGTAALDFRNGCADFDVAGNMNPKAIEDVIFPRYSIFTDAVRVAGEVRLSGRGTVDWRYMDKTSFEAEFEAQRVDLPMASLDTAAGSIAGSGKTIEVHDASFGIYGGTGEALFSVVLDPSTSGVPYHVDARISKVDFNKCLRYIDPAEKHTAFGELSGYLKADADFAAGFFESADGAGRVRIRDGQLADLPLFKGFSGLVRRLIPSFNVFSINRLSGDFTLEDGVFYSKNAYFDGKLLSAKGRGRYSARTGFDAVAQIQTFSDSGVSNVLRYITDPLLRLFEIRLGGTLKDPEWELKTFTSGSDDGKSGE